MCMKVYPESMGRTNIEIDDELLAKVMKLYRLRTKRQAVDFALRRLISEDPHRGMLALRGSGWDGDLDEMRQSRVVDL